MSGEHFKSNEEVADLREYLSEERRAGAVSGGIFGSRLGKGEWGLDSDIDVIIDDRNAPLFGDISYEVGKRSGTSLHIFRKKPGITGGASRYEEILDTAELTKRRLF